MDPELVKVVFAAVREQWEEQEAAFAGHKVHKQLESAGLNLSEEEMDKIWSYLNDLDAIQIDGQGDDGSPIIANVDPDWSPPHTNVTRI